MQREIPIPELQHPRSIPVHCYSRLFKALKTGFSDFSFVLPRRKAKKKK